MSSINRLYIRFTNSMYNIFVSFIFRYREKAKLIVEALIQLETEQQRIERRAARLGLYRYDLKGKEKEEIQNFFKMEYDSAMLAYNSMSTSSIPLLPIFDNADRVLVSLL